MNEESQHHNAAQIVHLLRQQDRFLQLEVMRKNAHAARRERRNLHLMSPPAHLPPSLSSRALLATEDLDAAISTGIQCQLEIIDAAMVKLLAVDGRPNAFDQVERSIDPDLPDDPTILSDPIVAYRYAMMRLYRRQFDVAFKFGKGGSWALVVVDLLEPLDGRRLLLTQQLPQAINVYPNVSFADSMPLATLKAMYSTFSQTYSEALKRLASYQADLEATVTGKTASDDVVDKKREALERMETICERVKGESKSMDWLCNAMVAKERRELEAAQAVAAKERELIEQAKLEREKVEKAWRDFADKAGKPIEGASDHVDRFERNHQGIGSC